MGLKGERQKYNVGSELTAGKDLTEGELEA